MSNVTTYTKDGVGEVKELIRLLVNDLTGSGTPSNGVSAAEHMKIIYPTDGSLDFTNSSAWPDDALVILEATTAMDPFADPDAGTPNAGTANNIDPWRIAFQTSKWTGRSTIAQNQTGTGWDAPKADPISVNSLAVYLGTPSTLNVDPTSGTPTIGWVTSAKQQLPYYIGIQPGQFQAWRFKPGYANKDLVEPTGNTGAQWTNTFDPTSNTTKFQSQPTGSQDPNPYTSGTQKWEGPDVTDVGQLFVNRYVISASKAASYAGFQVDSSYAQPISYQITVTDHGLFLGCWGPDPEENGKGFSWLVAQRPVDKKTGIIRGINPLTGTPYTGAEIDPITNVPIPIGNRPLFCVNSVGGNFWKFVVREHDNPVPSNRKNATQSTPDSGAVINPYQQQSLTENGEYVITFLNNLNTSRFKYSDELDMLGTVSSDVVGGGSQIDVSVYSEEQKRSYHALWSSGSFGTQMRVMVVANVPTPNQPWNL